MRFGFYAPNFDFCGDARVLADLASEAEAAGWDGFFIWDHLQFTEPVADPWVALTAMAMQTERIRLGTLVTPVPRRHLGKLAREVITLDHLSGGRLTLGVGAGYQYLPDYVSFGDGGDPAARAERFDESLDVLRALWSGEAVSHVGRHYRVECDAFQRCLQEPHVPVWVAATWPAKKPLRRAAQWEGASMAGPYGFEVEAADIERGAAFIAECRGNQDGFDIVRFGQTAHSDDSSTVRACANAGATWWMEYTYTAGTSLEAVLARVRQGPPTL